MIVEHGTDDVGVLLDFAWNSAWMILERHSGLLWKLFFVIVVVAVVRFYTVRKRNKPKASVKQQHHRHEDSDSDEEPAPRHLSSRGRSPHRH
jgi:hypothetical protein